jgi:hypothetical protein
MTRLEGQDVYDEIDGLERTVYKSDLEKQLRNLDRFISLAWSGIVRHLHYDPEENVLLHEIEGDLILWKDPSEEKIEEEVQKYPKAEVALGEKYDGRFGDRE